MNQICCCFISWITTLAYKFLFVMNFWRAIIQAQPTLVLYSHKLLNFRNPRSNSKKRFGDVYFTFKNCEATLTNFFSALRLESNEQLAFYDFRTYGALGRFTLSSCLLPFESWLILMPKEHQFQQKGIALWPQSSPLQSDLLSLLSEVGIPLPM